MKCASLVVRYARVAFADALFALAIVVVLMFGFARPAYAYVDPSVMTYTIQALAGVAVALSAVLGVVWRRVRRRLFRILRIDENANKEVDGEVHRLEPSEADYAQRRGDANERARRMSAALSVEKPERLGWGARFFFSFMASAMLFYTFVVVGPLEIVANSVNSLFFTVSDVWVPLAVVAAVGAVATSLAMSALRGRAFGAVFAIVALVGVLGYVQTMFLNGSLPSADGTEVDWSNYTAAMVASSLVWIAVLAVGVLLSFKKSLLFKGVASTVCVACIVAQSISLGLLLATPGDDGRSPVDTRPTVTMDGVQSVSSKENVIVFVLDTFDTRYLQEAVAEDSTCLDAFTGFTWFDNSTGMMIPTRYAMSSLLTGQSLDADDQYYSTPLIIDWYTQRNLLDDMNDLGYQVDVYATDIYDAIDSLSERVSNIKPLEKAIDYPAAISMLVQCSLYRDLPWPLKPPFWFYTDQVNNAVLADDSDNLAGSVWAMDDAAYYASLKERGLSLEDIGETGSFRMIHLAGSHAPYTIDRDARYVEGGTDCLEQSLGSLHIVEEYLAELKRLGVYDSATIMITADHGEWYLADEITGPTSPMLLVKPSTEAGGSGAPLTVSNVPTGHVDFAATILEAMGGDATPYGGMSVFDVPASERPRYYYSTSVVGSDHEYTFIKQWEITGDALDWENWRKTGVQWPIE